MRNTSMILALTLGLAAFNTFAQEDAAPDKRQDGPPPRQSDSKFDREQRFDRGSQEKRIEQGMRPEGRPDREGRLEPRPDREGRAPEHIRPSDGDRRGLERAESDRPAPKFRGPGGPAGPREQIERGPAPRHEGRAPAFGPKHNGPRHIAPDWNFCPFCGHTIKPALEGRPEKGGNRRHDGPGSAPAMAPDRRESPGAPGAPREEIRPRHRGPQDNGAEGRRGPDDAGMGRPGPVHRPAAPAEDAGR